MIAAIVFFSLAGLMIVGGLTFAGIMVAYSAFISWREGSCYGDKLVASVIVWMILFIVYGTICLIIWGK